MSSKNIYDVSPEQRSVMEWRDAKRRQLRELYLKDAQHPTKSLLFDTGIYRYAAAKASLEMHFVPRAIDFIVKVGSVAAVITLTAYYVKRRRDAREHLYRTGQVSYADRTNKFF